MSWFGKSDNQKELEKHMEEDNELFNEKKLTKGDLRQTLYKYTVEYKLSHSLSLPMHYEYEVVRISIYENTYEVEKIARLDSEKEAQDFINWKNGKAELK